MVKTKLSSKKAVKIIKKSKKDSEILTTDQYIESQLAFDWIANLGIQVGPKCNRKCDHCYGEYGPDRKGKASPRIVGKVLEDIADINLEALSIGDGEPFMHENKEVMRLISEFSASSDMLPIAIQTNAAFARTQENADNWFKFLKDNGFDFGEDGKLLAISLGKGYKVNPKNYFRAALAMRRAFQNVNLSDHLRFTVLGVEGMKIDNDSLNHAYTAIYSAFQDKGLPKIKNIDPDERSIARFTFDFGNKLIFEVRQELANPNGRANAFPIMDELYPLKSSETIDIGFSPDLCTALYVNYKGDVASGFSGMCVREGQYYGNVMKESLRSIKDKINNDPIYQANKLGGVRFMYFLANETEDFKLEMRVKCDICHAFFSDTELVDNVRKHLDQNGVVKIYKEYIERAGVPRNK